MRWIGALLIGLSIGGGTPAWAGNSAFNVGGGKIILSIPEDYCVLDRQSPTDALYRKDLEKYSGPAIAVMTTCENQLGLRVENQFKGSFDFIVFKPFSSLFGWNKQKWALFNEKTADWPRAKVLNAVKGSWKAASNRSDLKPAKIDYDSGAFQTVSAHATEDDKTLARATLMLQIKDALFIVQGYDFTEVYSPQKLKQEDLANLRTLNETLMQMTLAANR